jgi:TPR repeat protein
MSLLQRLGFGQSRTQEAIRAEQVSALRAALNKCRDVATRGKHMQRGVTVIVGVAMLALGFVLGTYREPLKQSSVDLLSPMGLAPSTRDVDAAYAAFDKGSYEKAVQIVRPLAENGDGRAQSLLARMYYRGRGMRQDHVEALKWFRHAAEQGDAIAQFNLGVMYSEGDSVPKDKAEAERWYRRAADQGNPQAQYNLGLWYAQGEDGTPDNVRAYMWFNLAAAAFPTGDVRSRSLAVTNRDAISTNMTSEQIAEAQKLAREWKPK